MGGEQFVYFTQLSRCQNLVFQQKSRHRVLASFKKVNEIFQLDQPENCIQMNFTLKTLPGCKVCGGLFLQQIDPFFPQIHSITNSKLGSTRRCK